MTTQRITIAQVAREAGVSTATVSLVLNGRSSSVSISEATQVLVTETARRMGYIPNQAARSLRSRRSGSVTMLLANLVNPFLTDIAAAAQASASLYNYKLNIVDVSRAETATQALEHLRSGGSDGVIIAVGHYTTRGATLELVQELGERGIPTIMVLDHSPDGVIPAIRVDNHQVAYLATRHLVRLGHTRIGFLAVAGTYPMESELGPKADRLRGYRQALDEVGLALVPEWIVQGPPAPSMLAGRALAKRLWTQQQPRPTAFITYNDITALGAMRGLYDLGVRVPDDVAVVGIGGIEMGEFSIPTLSSVAFPRVELGSLAVKTLFDLLDGKPPTEVERVLPVHLVVRESCGGGKFNL